MLNVDILDKKGGCPKKPAKDKQKTKAFRFVDTPRQITNPCFFSLLILFAAGALNIQSGQRAFIPSFISNEHYTEKFYIISDAIIAI